MSDLQRARILSAMTELVRERGAKCVTVAHVVARSGVSRRTFYELFEDRDDCVAASFESAVQQARALVVPAYEAAGDGWQPRIRAGLAALLAFLDESPAQGGLCVVDALGGDRALLERRTAVLEELVDVLHRDARSPGLGRENGGRAGRAQPRIVAEGTVGAVFAVLHSRIAQGDPKPLSALLNRLMSIIVLPYLGAAASAAELRRPSPRVRSRQTVPSDALRKLDMRLTYRTVRVLIALAEQPHANGRRVAELAGISDQGQMSKLLWRLEHLGLIQNSAPRRGRGEPNSWSLTATGREVQRTIEGQMSR